MANGHVEGRQVAGLDLLLEGAAGRGITSFAVRVVLVVEVVLTHSY